MGSQFVATPRPTGPQFGPCTTSRCEKLAHNAGHGPWDDDLHNIEETYLKGDGEFLVAELDGEIVAMGALRASGTGRAELKRMRVNPRYQRRGLGELILEQLETRARELGVRILQLDTTVAQTAAQHLYRKHGLSKRAAIALPASS